MAPMMLTIGQLAARTGVPVRTIRFWSDEGLLPETDRSRGGYRRYDAAAAARLDLVRTLRELGLGLDDVRLVLERRRSVEEVAASHVRAIDDRIRTLRTQRAVCTLLARGPHSPRKAALMNDLARLSAASRQEMIDEFIDAAFAGTDPAAPGAGIATSMRSLPAELPDDPTTEQVEAWVELAELVSDPAFRARVREMAVAGSAAGRPPAADPGAVAEHAGAALAAGVDPASEQAREVVERIAAPGVDRTELATAITVFADRRVERYWALLGVLNGWDPFPPTVPAFEWFAEALRAHPAD
ncbi:MerR family transcriptional regulator [Pseudonocardia sp. KRD-184]|uniref:MerR family transcriptional regulator n=2 Tax=Pseudonocardia oceani TaxID=2792013 RepID=A0ABS6UFV3_9PSEU|nr:MerR family transcriptional regulator [Pseudonocardia oceani]MBW0098191.1 MerR family transcriptional regulator [Pseudonocardia oceani]MBW0110412.1 MerR family transcriptional regulator [Pseudonocardia oceani]MBW0124453.1 MerR family transcriptional regulator [Pseudonocardia oceani]MBW0130811.1 MerR family transcriptional regulator [Pseudonocardia oceani]